MLQWASRDGRRNVGRQSFNQPTFRNTKAEAGPFRGPDMKYRQQLKDFSCQMLNPDIEILKFVISIVSTSKVQMAAKVTVSQCTVADSDALAHNNISAFWADPHWVLAWKHSTLEYRILQVAKRMPRNLLNDREIKRHQKAVHQETGRLVGYARWLLPEARATLEDGTPAWPGAMVPAVSAEEEAEIRRVAATAQWDPNEESDHLTKHIQEAKKGILARKDYIRKYAGQLGDLTFGYFLTISSTRLPSCASGQPG